LARFTPTTLTSTYEAVAALNSMFTQIQTLFEKCVFRDGTATNILTADLDLNNFDLLNIGSDTRAQFQGLAGTITVGSVTTGAAGSSVEITNTGTTSAATLNFTIPRGDTGATGPSPNISIGTVTTLATGESATASLTGTSPNYTLNLGIPMGATGSGASVAWGGITGTLSNQSDLNTALAAKAPLASPTLTGTPAAPTAAADTNTTQIATTAFVVGQGYAKLASPTLTGTPTAPTAAADTNTTQLATTAYVVGQGYAKLASPTFTGTPAAPTPSAGDNTTKIATTAFVATSFAPLASPAFTGTPTISSNEIGFRDLPIVAKSAAWTFANSERGKGIYYTGAAVAATIDPNSTTAITTGAVYVIYNAGSGSITVTRGVGVTMKVNGGASSADATIPAGGQATLVKWDTNTWHISGSGVS
jgi:hypothetical protein